MNSGAYIRLANLLKPVSRSESVIATKQYDILGARWYAKGLYIKETKQGSAIQANTLYRVEQGDFVYNRLFAWKGAFALASERDHSCHVSNEFPCFEVDRSRLDPKYLAYYFAQESSWNKALALSSGGTPTSRNRLKENRFLAMELPAIPLYEQQRIVAKIDGLASRVSEVDVLREQARTEASEIMSAAEREIWSTSSFKNAPTLEALTSFLARGRQSEQGESNHYLIKTQHVQQDRYVPTTLRLAPHIAAKVHAESIAQDGDILIACSAAGCLGRVARYKHDGRVASTDTHIAIARSNPDAVEPDYLYAYLRGAQGQYQLRSRERGDWRREKISFRLTELNLNDLKKVPVPVPSRSEQRRIVAELDKLQAEVNALTRLQTETGEEIDAVLPSLLSKAFAGEL